MPLRVLALLASLTVWPAAHAQWLGNTDLFLANSQSGDVVVDVRTGEPKFFGGLMPIPEMLDDSRSKGLDPFAVPPATVGSHIDSQFKSAVGHFVDHFHIDRRVTSSDGVHFATPLNLRKPIVFDVRDLRASRQFGPGRGGVIGFLGDKGEAVVYGESYGTAYSDESRLVVRELGTDRILYSRRFMGKRPFPGSMAAVSGAVSKRFLIMKRGKSFISVFDHKKLELVNLPFHALSAALSSDDRFLALGGPDLIVDTNTWTVSHYLKPAKPDGYLPGGMVMGGFLKDNRYLIASPSGIGTAVFDLTTGRLIDHLRGGFQHARTDPAGERIAYSAGGGYVMINTVRDGKLVSTGLCPDELCRPLPTNDGGMLHMKPDWSGFMIVARGALHYVDFASRQIRNFRFTTEQILAWMQQNHSLPPGIKCTLYFSGCRRSDPKLPVVTPVRASPGKEHTLQDIRAGALWSDGMCGADMAGCAPYWFTRGMQVFDIIDRYPEPKRLYIEQVVQDKLGPGALAEIRATYQTLYERHVVQGCEQREQSEACNALATYLAEDFELDRLEDLCNHVLSSCWWAALRIEQKVRSRLKDGGTLLRQQIETRIKGWSDAQEAQFQRIATRACREGAWYQACEWVPGLELVHVATSPNRSRHPPPAVRDAWETFAAELIEYHDKQDRAKGWVERTLSEDEILVRMPKEEIEACKASISQPRRC